MHVGCGLEKFGRSLKSFTDSLHGFGYYLWMSGAENKPFAPFSEQSSLVEARFFPHPNCRHILIREWPSHFLL
jgi:hypothetical protein